MKTFRILPPLCLLIALSAPAPTFASALLKPTSGVTQALSPRSLDIQTHLQGAFARTTLTTIYSNPNQQQIEADFLYTAPKGSVVTGFAYWYGKEKVVARVVEKGRAAKIYQYITSRMRDPALVEMIGKNAFRARIFPIEARADLKIEIQLAQTLPQSKIGPIWSYPLREETAEGPLDFSLRLRSNGKVVTNFGALKNGVINLNRPNFLARGDLRATQIEAPKPLRASLLAARDGGSDGFFALSLSPNSALKKPNFQILGVKCYDLIVPKTRIGKGESIVVSGRYRGSGNATAILNGRRVTLIFPAARERGNLASLLWATSRIEALSEQPRNRAAVLALSKRFSVPSKWTSWLAIPSQERRNFKKQMIASEREGAARAWAQAIARGDERGAGEQKRLVADFTAQLLKIDKDYSSNEELQPLPNYLNDELRNVRRALNEAKYGGASAKQRAQWNVWQRNLRRAGAKDGAPGIEMPVYVLEDELRIASRLLAMEVEAGRGKGSRARGLERRLKELASGKVAEEYGWNADTFESEQAELRANALAMEIAVSRLAKSPKRGAERAAQARLDRLAKRFDLDAKSEVRSALQSVGQERAARLARVVAVEEKLGQKTSKRAELERFARLLETRSADLLKVARTDLVRQDYNTATDQLASEILAGREDAARARDLNRKIETMRQNSTDYWQKDALSRAYTGRAHQLAFEIERERAKSSPDASKIGALEKKLGAVASQTGTGQQQFLKWEQARVKAGETTLDIEKYRYRVAGLNPNDFGGGYGGGDPLLAIEAPADAQSVVAVMPDGSVKKLEWRAQTRRWEANFDIPTGTMAGDYFVSLIIVERGGARKRLTMRFRVDAVAPKGQVKMANSGDETRLELEIGAPDDVERVTAILPWNERLVLRRDASGNFKIQAEVPTEYRGQKLKVRLFLNDRAHNRTEMLVDWN